MITGGRRGMGAATLCRDVPLRRVGRADEIAQAVVWLLSDTASHVTGTIVEISGGR
jgi:NAD(P)-dependent dehydrogenase (short-subunit alcohol dehydrogenase family)